MSKPRFLLDEHVNRAIQRRLGQDAVIWGYGNAGSEASR